MITHDFLVFGMSRVREPAHEIIPGYGCSSLATAKLRLFDLKRVTIGIEASGTVSDMNCRTKSDFRSLHNNNAHR
jgi:hypothetical protein